MVLSNAGKSATNDYYLSLSLLAVTTTITCYYLLCQRIMVIATVVDVDAAVGAADGQQTREEAAEVKKAAGKEPVAICDFEMENSEGREVYSG